MLQSEDVAFAGFMAGSGIDNSAVESLNYCPCYFNPVEMDENYLYNLGLPITNLRSCLQSPLMDFQ